MAKGEGAAQCGRCQGWFLEPRARSERGARLAADLVCVSSSTPRRCPACAVPMSTFRSPRVEIDACDQCLGVFLDRGELELLQQRTPANSAPPRVVPASAPAREERSGAGDAALSVAGGVLGLLVEAIFDLW